MTAPIDPIANPKIYPSWPSPYAPSPDIESRENTLAILEEGVQDHVRDLGRIASWTVDRLVDNGVQPNVTVESLVTHKSYARGWHFWERPYPHTWTLLENAMLIPGVKSGGKVEVTSRYPEKLLLDFESGVLREDVEGSPNFFGVTNNEVLSVLSLFGVTLQQPVDPGIIIRLFPRIGTVIAQHRATEGWRNAFRAFLKKNNLPLPPPDL